MMSDSGDRSLIGATGEGPSLTLMTLAVNEGTERAHIPARLGRVRPLHPQAARRTRRIVFDEQMDQLKFYINGKRFDPLRVDQRPQLGSTELWEIANISGMDHPFHLHTNLFQVYARDGRREQRAVWRDMVNVKAQETVQILVPFRDYRGKTVYHCHIVEHEDRGMMAVVEMV